MDNNLLEQLSDSSKNIFGFDKNSLSKNYTKTYVSNKKKNERLYFKIDFYFSVTEDYEKRINFNMNVYISYLFLIKNRKCIKIKQTPSTNNSWNIKTYPDRKSCGLVNSIMIHEDFRSYGIGTFLLNEVLSIANTYIPDYSLSAGLGYGDEKEEDNKERRNSLYRNIGFDFLKKGVNCGDSSDGANEIYIDKISNLNFDRKIKYIKEVEPLKLSTKICNILNRLDSLKKENKELSKSNISYETDNKKLLTTLGAWQISSCLIGVAAIILLIAYIRFFN